MYGFRVRRVRFTCVTCIRNIFGARENRKFGIYDYFENNNIPSLKKGFPDYVRILNENLRSRRES